MEIKLDSNLSGITNGYERNWMNRVEAADIEIYKEH